MMVLLLRVLSVASLSWSVVAFVAPRRAGVAPPPRRVAFALLDDLKAAGTEEALSALVAQHFDSLDGGVVQTLLQGAQGGDAESVRVMTAIQAENGNRMTAARVLLEDILDQGDLFAMDKRLVQYFKEGRIDPTFMLVLGQNVEAAGATPKGQALGHVYTRAQEEFEKLVDPADGILHKLARTDQPVIRQNIMAYYLAPQTEILLPNATAIPLADPRPPMVSADAFAGSIAAAVQTLRALDGSTTLDPAIVEANVEAMRQIAKEARLVIQATSPPETLHAFEDALFATFAPAPTQGEGAAAASPQ